MIQMSNFFKKNYKISYSQNGEDIIIKIIFDAMGIKNPSYIDIGANDPEYMSNTALFYKEGSRGINIEPDPVLFKRYVSQRKRDINLNIGISDTSGESEFYIMSERTLNTFSESSVNDFKKYGYSVNKIIKVKIDTIKSIISEYCNGKFPEFLTLDVEGYEYNILKTIDFDINYPLVICVETLSFTNNYTGVKNIEIIDFLKSKGYMIYADTYINTIFVKKDRLVSKT